jgi:hypothetical protein
MKKQQFIFFIIGFILLILIVTNPSTIQHKEAVKEKVITIVNISNSDKIKFEKLGGMLIVDNIKRDNYLFISLTNFTIINGLKEIKIFGIGFLGKVYFIEYEVIEQIG